LKAALALVDRLPRRALAAPLLRDPQAALVRSWEQARRAGAVVARPGGGFGWRPVQDRRFPLAGDLVAYLDRMLAESEAAWAAEAAVQ
ncbi:MAG: hypothetical protein OWV35_02560, partial [Firmicutes bacterium]|nr:hypothetical protein [Bacillota bacterium]